MNITVAALPIAAAVIGWLYLNVFRSLITYRREWVQFGENDKRYNPSNSVGLMAAEFLYLRNRSQKSLRDVKIRLSNLRDCLIGEFRGNTVGELDRPGEDSDGTMIFVVPEFPSGERVTIKVLHRGTGHLSSRRLQSGGNRYRIVEEFEYSSLRGLVIFLVLFVAAICLSVLWPASR